MAAKPAATGSLSINEGTGPFHYGDTLTFTSENSKVGGGWPMVEVGLFQDVDFSGEVETGLFDGDLVAVSLNHPDQTFLLSPGEADVSKPAKGKARLLMYGWKGKQEFIIPLASVDFDVEA